jgi:hypothetical protein
MKQLRGHARLERRDRAGDERRADSESLRAAPAKLSASATATNT